MRYLISILIFLFSSFVLTLSVEEDYYWRQYTGTISPDAIIAGKDINSKNVYIGQVYVKNWGIFVVEIHPGIREVLLHINGKMVKQDSEIKILCGVQHNFYWQSVNAANLHLQLLDKHAVIGGHVDPSKMLNIGRISVEGETRIGRVLGYNVGDARMYFTHKGKETGTTTYEVLLFKEVEVDIRVE